MLKALAVCTVRRVFTTCICHLLPCSEELAGWTTASNLVMTSWAAFRAASCRVVAKLFPFTHEGSLSQTPCSRLGRVLLALGALDLWGHCTAGREDN